MVSWEHSEYEEIKQEIKRFMVFMWESYYPGGWRNDLFDSFNTLEEAKRCIKIQRDYYDYIEIYDRIDNIIYVLKKDE